MPHRLLGFRSHKATVQIKAIRVFGIAGRDDHRFYNLHCRLCKVRRTAAAPADRGRARS